MRKGTNPILLSVSRMFQSIPPVFLTWIEFLIPKKKSNTFPIIFIISPPRSGSTITYQILNKATRSLYLSNIWNLLYALPYFGGKFTTDVSKNKDFKSDRGLVSGLSGESEGMRFWSYWMGQNLEDRENLVPENRLKYIKSVFSTLLRKDKPMISGYLGHAFSVEFLRDHFQGCMFIYLKRDELSNVYSMIKTYKEFEKNRKDFNWMSLKPIGWEDKIEKEVADKVLWQYRSIKQKIESEISDKDTLTVNYEEICRDPKQFLKDLQIFSFKHNINLKLTLDNIPESFDVSKIDPNQDKDAKIIYDLLQNE
jgi:hypothetical protein